MSSDREECQHNFPDRRRPGDWDEDVEYACKQCGEVQYCSCSTYGFVPCKVHG